MWILLCNFIFFIGLGTSWSPYGNLGYLVRWSFTPRVGKAREWISTACSHWCCGPAQGWAAGAGERAPAAASEGCEGVCNPPQSHATLPQRLLFKQSFAFSPLQKATDWIQMSHGLDGFIGCYQRSVWRSHCDRREVLGLAVLQSQPLFCNYNFVPVQYECFINLLKQIQMYSETSAALY